MLRIIKKQLFFVFFKWGSYKELSFNTDKTLNLSLVRLPFEKQNEMNLVIVRLLSIAEIKKNLGRVAVHSWLQQTNRKNLTISKLKIVMRNQQFKKQAKNHAFSLFQLASRYQTDFTDVL